MENYTDYQDYTNYSYNYDYDPSEMPIPTARVVTSSVLLYLGICTNIWMLWSLYKTWEVGRRGHFYLLGICISDLLGVCILCSMDIGELVTFAWEGGEYGCKIFKAGQRFFPILAHFILAGFNVDNVITIICERSVKPIRVVFLLLSILMTAGICIPLAIFYQTRMVGVREDMTWCIIDGKFSGYLFLQLIGSVAVPLFIILFMGSPSLCLWCAKKEAISYHRLDKEYDVTGDMKYIGRDIAMALAYDVLFILCWTPTVLVLILGYYLSSTAYLVANALTMANSVINPLLYAFCNCMNRSRSKVSPAL